VLDGLKGLFISDNGLEHHQFPPLHKIVLELTHSNLEAYLKVSTVGIDERDARGRTSLYWASRRGDVKATRLLLDYGANPNLGNAHNVTPLHHAASAVNPHCIELLLEKGADVDRRDDRQQIALHYMAFYRNDISYALPLLKHKSNVNTQARQGITPLTFAATRDHDKAAKCLLDHGADIELADDYGTPLFNAVNFNSHRTIKLLLDTGADCGFRDASQNTLLHKAAKVADEETLEILMSMTAGSIDCDELNAEGKTANSIFSDRRVVSDDLIKAWDRLVIYCQTDMFYDCLEHIS
jgi:ankyrin repeat protein